MLLVPFGSSASSVLDYDARLCSVDLVILQGDLKRLQLTSTTNNHRRGLQKRIESTLGTLSWLCRRYASLHDLNRTQIQISINALQLSYEQQNLEQLSRQILTLIERMPLNLDGYLPADAMPQSSRDSEKIYYRYCAACHKTPDLTAQTPAYSLVEMADKMAPREFIARMLGGVRGTAEIALHNPLSKQDIAGLYDFLLRSATGHEQQQATHNFD